jgi:hypothetical protein
MGMFPQVSDDVRKLLEFELEHGNEVFSFGAASGYSFFVLRIPCHTGDAKWAEALSETIQPWVWESPHYEEKYQGFRSNIFPGDAVVVRNK